MGYSRDPHKFLVKCLKDYGNLQEIEISIYLDKLRKCRNNADYYSPFQKKFSKRAKRYSEIIFKILENLEKEN